MNAIRVNKVSVPGQQKYQDSVFPLVYMSQSAEGIESITDWLKSHKNQLEEDLSAHGAILFRDLEISNDKEFDRFIRAFDWPSFTYKESLSNAVRQNRTDLVFTANEAPPSVSIFLHHEMAQTPIYP